MILLAMMTALADPCADTDAMPTGPVRASMFNGHLGSPKRTCARDEVGGEVRADATIETADFYGYLMGSAAVSGSLALGNTEIYGDLELFRVDLGITSLQATELGLGHLTLGASHAFIVSEKAAIGINGSVVLPTASALYQNAWPFGFTLAVNNASQVSKAVRLHATAGLRASVVASSGSPDPRIGAHLNFGTELRPAPVFAMVIDLDAAFAYNDPVDFLAVGAGLRFTDQKHFGFELGTKFPFYGADRSLVALEIRGTYRFGSPPGEHEKNAR